MTRASAQCPRCARAVSDLDVDCPFCGFQFRMPSEGSGVGGARSHAGVPAYVQEEARMRRWRVQLRARGLGATLGRGIRLAFYTCVGLAILCCTWVAWRWYHRPPWVIDVEIVAPAKTPPVPRRAPQRARQP